MFAKEHKKKQIIVKNQAKWTVYISSIRFEPIPKERASFQEFQRIIYKKLILYHPDPDKQLFFQIDGFIEYGFNIIIYYLKRDFYW